MKDGFCLRKATLLQPDHDGFIQQAAQYIQQRLKAGADEKLIACTQYTPHGIGVFLQCHPQPQLSSCLSICRYLIMTVQDLLEVLLPQSQIK